MRTLISRDDLTTHGESVKWKNQQPLILVDSKNIFFSITIRELKVIPAANPKNTISKELRVTVLKTLRIDPDSVSNSKVSVRSQTS